MGMNVEYSIANQRDLYMASTPRGKYSSKGSNGRLLVIGGSERFHGAPALASGAAYEVLAALRIGVGYVVEFVPKGVLGATRSVSPDIIVEPLAGNNLGPRDAARLIRELKRSDCLVMGPGLGKGESTLKTTVKLIEYIKRTGKRAVIDADALYALKKYPRKLGNNFIITPNKEEFKLFYKVALKDTDTAGRISAAMMVAADFNANVVLKGHQTIVTDGKRVKVIKAKSSALAVMGSGDVLAGIIGGFATKNSDLFIAAVAGAHLHTTIGDILYKKKGNHILASDVVAYIPKILKRFDR
jgi:hydroxyethylthiazole kinase-like uncharacterized protein yjeF